MTEAFEHLYFVIIEVNLIMYTQYDKIVIRINFFRVRIYFSPYFPLRTFFSNKVFMITINYHSHTRLTYIRYLNKFFQKFGLGNEKDKSLISPQ